MNFKEREAGRGGSLALMSDCKSLNGHATPFVDPAIVAKFSMYLLRFIFLSFFPLVQIFCLLRHGVLSPKCR